VGYVPPQGRGLKEDTVLAYSLLPVTRGQIIDRSITVEKIERGELIATITPLVISATGNLAADSTGVKYETNPVRLYTKNIKEIKLQGSWDASETDSKTAIELYDKTKDEVIASISGNTGDNEETDISVDKIFDGHLYTLRVNVTTASGTSGATTAVSYAVLEMKWEAS